MIKLGCMEHHCSDPGCDAVIIDNNPEAYFCPFCGKKMYLLCDELPEKPADESEEDDDNGYV